MKALIIDPQTYALNLQEVATPTPTDGEVLIRLRAASINHLDLWYLDEKSLESSFQGIMGSDGAGVVMEAGRKVDPAWKGKEVVINPSLFWGNDEALPGPSFQILGNPKQGTFAEYIAVPKEQVYEIPAHLTFEEAAALPMAFLTAYRALFTKGRLQKKQRVLITGIGGGVALASLQLALAAGAEAYVTSGSHHKLKKAMELGAYKGVVYTEEKWNEWLLDNEAGFDLIVDSAAGKGFSKLTELAKPGGTIVLIGRTAGIIDGLNPRNIFSKQLTIQGSLMGTGREFEKMLKFIGKHAIHPVLDTLIGLPEITKGFSRMAEKEQIGKIIIKI